MARQTSLCVDLVINCEFVRGGFFFLFFFFYLWPCTSRVCNQGTTSLKSSNLKFYMFLLSCAILLSTQYIFFFLSKFLIENKFTAAPQAVWDDCCSSSQCNSVVEYLSALQKLFHCLDSKSLHNVSTEERFLLLNLMRWNCGNWLRGSWMRAYPGDLPSRPRFQSCG